MIKEILLNELAAHIDKRCIKAEYTIGGKVYPAKIRRSIASGKVVRKHIYLTQEDPYGTVTSARLIGENGEVLAERTDLQEHEQGKGLLLEFKFEMQEG